MARLVSTGCNGFSIKSVIILLSILTTPKALGSFTLLVHIIASLDSSRVKFVLNRVSAKAIIVFP
jgi:hypothetical protein